MKTIWTPVTKYERKQWLLANGEIVTEPDLEETPSGLKVRVVGTDLSAYSKDLDDLLQRAVVEIAKERGTKLWMSMNRLNEQIALGFDRGQYAKAEINVVANAHKPTILWWRFKHAELPIEATIVVKVQGLSSWQAANNYPYIVSSSIVHQLTTLDSMNTATVFSTDEDLFTSSRQRAGMGYDDELKWDAYIRDNPPVWDTRELGDQNYPNTRVATKRVLQLVRSFEQLSEIDIPDFRDIAQPGWLRLELFDSNVHAGVEQECLDLLDGEVTLKEAMVQYEEFRNTLRKLGLVLDDKEENHFATALQGTQESLTVDVLQPLNEGGGPDHEHTLSIHLPTGTMYVHCSKSKQDMDVVAERWEEAQLIASLSGKEDELLAYAREYVKRKQTSVMKKLVKDRDVTD